MPQPTLSMPRQIQELLHAIKAGQDARLIVNRERGAANDAIVVSVPPTGDGRCRPARPTESREGWQ
jgi:hypothetical protein